MADGAGPPHRARTRDAIALTWILGYDAELVEPALAVETARLHLAGEGGGEGIERAPRRSDGWLEQRRFHYSAIISSEAPDPESVEALARSQPQAPHGVNLVGFFNAEFGPGGGRRRLDGALRHAGIPHTTIPYEEVPHRQEHPFEHAEGEVDTTSTSSS